ncbi:ComEA family DNA-binding protein [Ferrimonas balearica]|uniref:ComEA family DNA-binding protein n=1 Tax=Ferrimonas balearica TaxID=44012 RepID=UPI001C942C50|nr:ComEA family DNA-binding protein [Ferrimonas balearica]
MWKALILAIAVLMAPVATLAVEEPSEAVQTAQVNINTADAETLANGLVGVGAKKAQAIITHREQHGPFSSKEELLQVKGIGPELLSKNRERIQL